MRLLCVLALPCVHVLSAFQTEINLQTKKLEQSGKDKICDAGPPCWDAIAVYANKFDVCDVKNSGIDPNFITARDMEQHVSFVGGLPLGVRRRRPQCDAETNAVAECLLARLRCVHALAGPLTGHTTARR